MMSPFTVVVMTIGVLALVVVVVTAIYLAREYFSGARRFAFWTKVGVPLTTPIIVALLGVLFSVVAGRQQKDELDNQKKIELLREVVASKDRPDIAFLTAVGNQLVIRLDRHERIHDEVNRTMTEDKRKALAVEQEFTDRAAYFFLGMFHSARIDFYASKGYKLYPRLWMEAAFDGLVARVETLAFGDDASSPDVSGIEESALYKYFGEAAGTYRNITSRSGEPRKTAVLFDFNLMLDGKTSADVRTDPYRGPLEDALRSSFGRFRERINRPEPGALKVGELKLTIAAITALDDYAFNKLFAGWYKGPGSPAEVKSLADDIPGTIPPDPPAEYLFYPLRGWENQDIRDATWKIIYDQVPDKFKGL